MPWLFGIRGADLDRPSAFRLLQVSPEEARRVICAPKEVVEEFQEEAWTRGLDPWVSHRGLFGSGSWEVPTVGGERWKVEKYHFV